MHLRTFYAVGLCLWAALSTAAEARPTLLFDAANGQVLYAEDVDHPWYPASLTKIMTAYVTFAALKSGKVSLDTKIGCSEAAHAQPPSKVGLPVGAEMTVDLALKALIIKSANDVAVMLSEAVGGSEEAFVEEMNRTAQRLGMTRTRFVNPHGLPAPEQVTTARDLAHLARAVVRDFPEYSHYWSMSDMRIGNRRLGTHNSLLKTYDGADGLKTGFICDSGYNVVASASRDGRRLVAVVLGEASSYERALKAATLLEHGFQMQGWKALFNPADLATLPASAAPSGPISVRTTVVSWNCGGRPRARVARTRVTKEQKVVAKAKGEGPPAASTGADEPSKPKAKQAPKPKPETKPKSKAAQAPVSPAESVKR